MNKTERDLLTPREWEVLALVREGLTNEQIADRLGISRDGAKYHVSEILGKLGLNDRIEAAAWYSRNRPALARFAAFGWPLALLRRLGSPFGLAGAILGLAALILAAVAIGVIIMEGRSSDNPAPPLVQATSTATPEPSPEPSPELPGFAPDGRTGIAEVDGIINDFLSMGAAELEAGYGALIARDATIDGHPSLAAAEWIPWLTNADRSLYAAYREEPGSGIVPAREVNLVLSVAEADGRLTGWSLAIDNGQVVDLIIGESPSAYTPDVGFNYERFLVLPPRDELPQPSASHALSTRTGNADVDGILELVEQKDGAGLSNLLEPSAVIQDCAGTPSQNDAAVAELLSRIAEDSIGLHAVAILPEGYLPQADHRLILIIEDSPYAWSAAVLLQLGGRIIGLDSCPDYAVQALYPPRDYPVPPLADPANLDVTRRSGNEVVDAFLDALAANDMDALLGLLSYGQIGCVTESLGIGTPPICQPGEAEGTLINVISGAQCEGYYLREADMPDALSRLLTNPWALYAVVDVGEDPGASNDFLRSHLQVIVSNPAGSSEPFTDSISLWFDETGLTSMFYPCGQATPAQMISAGVAPDFLLPPP